MPSTATVWLSSLQRLEGFLLLPSQKETAPMPHGSNHCFFWKFRQSYLWIKMQLPRLLVQDLHRGLKTQERRKAELSFDVCKCKLQT